MTYRNERLKTAMAEYLAAFKVAFEQYGHTDTWPFIVERGITDDMQVLERLESARKEWNDAEKA